MSTPSSSRPTQGDHIQDLHNLLQGMTLSDSSFDTVTWTRKTTKETTEKSITLSTSTPAKKPTPCQVTAVPKPSEIYPPRAGETPEGFWAITVGQEVGVFYHWANVAERTNFISGNVQKCYPSFQQALTAYTVKYNEGRVRAVPLPGDPFWPSSNPPSPTSSVGSFASSDSYDLWLQVEDLTETMSQL
ncbi:hypothetical protein F4604DRAFT_1689562 [Suillus subluteus]|nr:hypothetical protein F4604DRAFT_1689562 [Suillus subluteus]